MHLLVRETRTLDDDQGAVDLRQTPGDVVFLSFSDSDLGAAAAAWQAMGADRPTLRLANLARLRHPMSVDLYVEQVIEHARCVVLRLLGGLDYWLYGAQEIAATCSAKGIPLAIIPGDARDDARLRQLSTAPVAALAALDGYCRFGGPANLAQAVRLAAHLGGLGMPPTHPPAVLPSAGEYPVSDANAGGIGLAVIVFYRSHLLAGDVAPVDALATALRARGMDVRAIHVASLKDPEAASFVVERLRAWRPAVVLNATSFSASQDKAGSPLDVAGVPVLQLILAVAGREAWEQSSRGLSQSDLAMQVVLPEIDGRLLTTAISFKTETEAVDGLDFVKVVNQPDADGIALAADRALGWARLASKSPDARRVAIVLSDYPGGNSGQVGHAVGLDTLASLLAIVEDLQAEAYDCGPPEDSAGLTDGICHAEPVPTLALPAYRQMFARLPAVAQARLIAAWGDPVTDPTVVSGYFAMRHIVLGRLVVAVQPDRGREADRKTSYHDPDLPPRHAYVAFYLWLRHVVGIDVLVHLGTHGTLEWLPGKAAALSASCIPVALMGGLPVIYPFIVNNPGEAAAAKRRLGAVTIGHLTPPLKPAGTQGAAIELERLIDEFATADGLDRRRAGLLRREILEQASSAGLLAESGIAHDAPADEALARLDAYLCDVKELQIRDGLHVFGRVPTPEAQDLLLVAMQRASPDVAQEDLAGKLRDSAPSERRALLEALDGRRVMAGPSGAPTRGRADVLPTGRNLFTIDPRAVPTRSALILAERAATELLRRHRQDHGEWLRSLVIDLWGSASMRTGGEDLALALVLIGARPLWDTGSARVNGIEILPLALLERPRVDVTLRVSGVFRDVFESQILLFDAAVRAIAAREEAADWNPLAASVGGLEGAALRRATSRVFGAAPGTYGAGLSEHLDGSAWELRDKLAGGYLAASCYAYGKDGDGADAEGFAALVAAADAFVHTQDHAETDLLDSSEYAAHEGGFAAAAASLGGSPALYHMDTSRPEAPRARMVGEEIARVVRGRAANPSWIAGMRRHGYRGAAEIARTVDGLHAFAATLPQRLDPQFELLFDATLGDPAVDDFLRRVNPLARAAMAERFQDALRRDLWRSRRNAVVDILAA